MIKNVAEYHTHIKAVGGGSGNERMAEVKVVVISYDLWMGRKSE